MFWEVMGILEPTYIQKMPENLVRLYAQAEMDILENMAVRIAHYGYWIPAVEHQAKMLEEAGMVREEILARLKTLTGRTDRELQQLMQEAGGVSLKSDDAVYRRQGMHPPPVSASEDLQKVLQAGYEKTAGTFRNLTRTTAHTAAHQFAQALDRAYMQITLGGMDYSTAIRSTIKQLSAEGVGAIRYPTGRTDTIEVAVRRAVVTGVNQTALRLQDARADEMGADLVEVSAHAGARPSHAEWQGGIYSRSGKSRKYPDFVKTTGYGTGAGLGGWNCSHSFRPWFEGMSRTYDKALLKEYQAKDYEYNGVKMTEYEALQEQRRIERGIRRWKRERNAMEAAGLDSSEASAKITEWNRRQRDFLEQTGLKADGMRVAVGKNSYTPIEKRGIITLTPANEDALKEKDFSELSSYVGKLSDRAVRKWYIYHDEQIPGLIDKTKPIEEQARQACALRNQNRTNARDLMRDQEKRQKLDLTDPNKSFEELLEYKMAKKGLSREDAINDILATATKTRKSVNKMLGLEG